MEKLIEAIDRIQQAAGGLEDRIQDVDQQEAALSQIELKLIELTDYLIAAHRPAGTPIDIAFA